MLIRMGDCEKTSILGVDFDCVDIPGAIRIIEEFIISGHPHYIVTPNLHFIALADRNGDFRRVINNAHLSLADGMPLIWFSKLSKKKLKDKVSGSDITTALCEHLSKTSWSIFFLGTTDEICRTAAQNLMKIYPGLKVAGHYSPPFGDFNEAEQARILNYIQKAQPQVVLVALGNPKQEFWMASNCNRLGVPVLIGIGCSLDFAAGTLKRAPEFIQKSGLEWLFRIIMEPRRLAPRYLRDIRDLVGIILSYTVKRGSKRTSN